MNSVPILCLFLALVYGSPCPQQEAVSHQVVCYYEGKTPLSKINICECTDLIFTDVVKIAENYTLDVYEDVKSDLATLKERNALLRTFFTLTTKQDLTSTILKSDAKRRQLAASVTSFLNDSPFSGVELDFKLSSNDGVTKESLVDFFKILRQSLASVPHRRVKRGGYDVFEKVHDDLTTASYSTERVKGVRNGHKPQTTKKVVVKRRKNSRTTREDKRENVDFYDEEEEELAAIDEDLEEVSVTRKLRRRRKEPEVEQEEEEPAVTGQDTLLLLRLSVKPEIIAKKYDLKALSKYIDLFMVPTHDISDESESQLTYHPSRLMGLSDMLNTDSVLDLLTGLGAPKSMVVISLPATALKFKLKDAKENVPRSQTEMSPVTINQHQLCSLLNSGDWTLERDDDLTAPYAFSGKTWVAFEDTVSVNIKGKYILLRELAGGAVYPIDADVTNNACGNTTATISGTLLSNFRRLDRKPRDLVLQSLQDEIHDTSFSSVEAGVRLSEYRIVRVVDHSGAVHVIRKNAKTEFECSRQGYFSHPLGCNKFYRCVKFNQYTDDFTVFEYDCPAGLAFDERWEVCVWPGSLPHGAPCTGSSEIAPVPRSHYECPNAEGYYADPENCRWFFACLDHARDGVTPLTAYEFRCPFGLVFDEGKLACDWPWLVGGCGLRGASGVVVEKYAGIHSGLHSATFINGGNLEASLGQYGAAGAAAAAAAGQATLLSGLNGAQGTARAYGASHYEASGAYIASGTAGASGLAASGYSTGSGAAVTGNAGIGVVGITGLLGATNTAASGYSTASGDTVTGNVGVVGVSGLFGATNTVASGYSSGSNAVGTADGGIAGASGLFGASHATSAGYATASRGGATAGSHYISSGYDDNQNRASFATLPDYEISGGRIVNKGGVILNHNIVGVEVPTAGAVNEISHYSNLESLKVQTGQQGYVYDKPAVKLELPQVVLQKQTPSAYHVPVVTPRPFAVDNAQVQINHETYLSSTPATITTGYSFSTPSVELEAPAVTEGYSLVTPKATLLQAVQAVTPVVPVSKGYSYAKPAVQLQYPSVTPSVVTQTDYSYAQPAIKLQLPTVVKQHAQQVFVPAVKTVAAAVPVAAVTQGYSYAKPAVRLELPKATVVQSVTPVISQGYSYSNLELPAVTPRAPLVQTAVPVLQTVSQGHSFSSLELPAVTPRVPAAVVQTVSQGYSYSKPAIRLELPAVTPKIPVVQTVSQGYSYSNVDLPVKTQLVQSPAPAVVQTGVSYSNLQLPVVTPRIPVVQGYSYSKPAVQLQLPSVTPRIPVVQTASPVIQPVSQTYSYVKPVVHQPVITPTVQPIVPAVPAVSYNYPKPAVQLQLPIVSSPQPVVESHSYAKPAVKVAPKSYYQTSLISPAARPFAVQQPSIVYSSTPRPEIYQHEYLPPVRVTTPQVAYEKEIVQKIQVSTARPVVSVPVESREYLPPPPVVTPKPVYRQEFIQVSTPQPVVQVASPKSVTYQQNFVQVKQQPIRPVVYEQKEIIQPLQVSTPKTVFFGQKQLLEPVQVSTPRQVFYQQASIASPKPVIYQQQQVVAEVTEKSLEYLPPPPVVTARPVVYAQKQVVVNTPRPVVYQQPTVVLNAQKPVVYEQKVVVNTPRPVVYQQPAVVVNEQKPVVYEQKVVVNTPRPLVYQQPAVVVNEQKPVVYEQKVVVNTPRPVVYQQPAVVVNAQKPVVYQQEYIRRPQIVQPVSTPKEIFYQERFPTTPSRPIVVPQVSPQPVVYQPQVVPVEVSTQKYFVKQRPRPVVVQEVTTARPYLEYLPPRTSTYAPVIPLQPTRRPVTYYATPKVVPAREEVVSVPVTVKQKPTKTVYFETYERANPAVSVLEQEVIQPVSVVDTPVQPIVETYKYTTQAPVIVPSLPRVQESREYLPPLTETISVQDQSFVDLQKVNKAQRVKTYNVVTEEPLVAKVSTEGSFFETQSFQGENVDSSYVYTPPQVKLRPVTKYTVNSKIEIAPPPEEYLLEVTQKVSTSTSEPEVSTRYTVKARNRLRTRPTSSTESSREYLPPPSDNYHGDAYLPPRTDRRKSKSKTTIVSIGEVDKQEIENENVEALLDKYSGRFGDLVEEDKEKFITKVIQGNAKGTIKVGKEPGTSTVGYEVTSSRPRSRGRGRKFGSSSSTTTTTSSYEEEEEVATTVAEEDTAELSLTSLDLKNLKIKKDKKTVIVVSQVSDANPILIGKLAGQCSCQSNNVELRRKGKRPSSGRRGEGAAPRRTGGDDEYSGSDNEKPGDNVAVEAVTPRRGKSRRPSVGEVFGVTEGTVLIGGPRPKSRRPNQGYSAVDVVPTVTVSTSILPEDDASFYLVSTEPTRASTTEAIFLPDRPTGRRIPSRSKTRTYDPSEGQALFTPVTADDIASTVDYGSVRLQPFGNEIPLDDSEVIAQAPRGGSRSSGDTSAPLYGARGSSNGASVPRGGSRSSGDTSAPLYSARGSSNDALAPRGGSRPSADTSAPLNGARGSSNDAPAPRGGSRGSPRGGSRDSNNDALAPLGNSNDVYVPAGGYEGSDSDGSSPRSGEYTVRGSSGSKVAAGAAFDRYGPGGMRGADETLQGSVDCKRPGLFRHPKYCNKFYACNYDPWKKRYTLHVFNCPIHLAYDSNLGACNWPSKGPACSDDNLLL